MSRNEKRKNNQQPSHKNITSTSSGYSENLIISVKEARKLLGKDASKMTDEQIQNLIMQLDNIATLSIRQFKKELDEGKASIK